MTNIVRYTPEQADVMDWITENDGILLIEAGAGCGKTFIAKQVVETLKPKSGIYTAFNRAIVEEGKERFKETAIQCKTFHSLAYKYVNPKLPIEPLTYRCITGKFHLTYSEKRLVIDTIDKFFVSSSTCMYDFFEEELKDNSKCTTLAKICSDFVIKMAEDEINPTFNFMLKSLHLMLVEKTVNINVAIVILDEINDVTAVSLEIFKLINAPKKLGLGETHQAIYEFLNLVNGFEELADCATTMKLTQSYRCSTNIAKAIQKKMRKYLSPDFTFAGTDNPVANGLTLVCTLTNALIVDAIYERLLTGKGFTLLRKPAEIFAAPLAVLTASKGKKPYQARYNFLLDLFEEYQQQNKHKSYFKHLQAELDDDEINNAIKLLMKLNSKNVNLFSLYKDAKNATVDPTYTISTAFTSKGLEFEKVIISDDLNSNFTSAINGEFDTATATTSMRCYYVACSRSGKYLQNSVL